MPIRRPAAHFQSELSRRRFLRGAGALIALPFFESLGGRGTRPAQAAPDPPKRLLFYYVPNGMHMPAWTPAEAGPDYQLTPILMPLATLKDDVLPISGLGNKPAQNDGSGEHSCGTSAFLTCAHARKSETELALGVSVDQVAAAQLGRGQLWPSLQLGLGGGALTGGCETGYSCAYNRNISWAGPQTPLPKIMDPRLAFDLLFGGMDAGQSAEELARRRRDKKSVLDYALDEASRLRGQLGPTDRRKLDEYLDGIRGVELRLSMMGGVVGGCSGAKDPGANLSFPEQVRAMSDIMVLAMQCDLTRVISFMLGNGGSIRSYAFLGINGAHHELSHHQNDPKKQALLQIIDTWEVEQLGYLLSRMKTIPEGAGTLLDNSLVYFSSELADGQLHTHTNLPVLVAGRLGGAVRPGRHLVYKDAPLGNLFTSILQGVGISASRFGDDGTGPLDGLV